MKSREYPERPIIGVGVCVLCQENILLVQRANPPRPGSWSLPGGAQNIGETLEECAVREISEETGLDIYVTRLIDVVDSINYDDSGNVLFHYTLVDYIGRVLSGNLCPGGDALAVRWCSRIEVDELIFWEETRRIIKLAFELDSEC